MEATAVAAESTNLCGMLLFCHVESDVDHLRLAGEEGATLVRVVAHRDDVVELGPLERVHVLLAVS